LCSDVFNTIAKLQHCNIEQILVGLTISYWLHLESRSANNSVTECELPTYPVLQWWPLLLPVLSFCWTQCSSSVPCLDGWPGWW